MPAQRNKNQINLLPEAGFEITSAGRILSWILSTFRIIVIVTEIIVMIAFLSRFWLDAQNTDLNDKIEEKEAVLTASKDFEQEFKNTQKKLAIFSELTEDEGIYSEILNTVVSYLPPDLFLSAITFERYELKIEGNTINEVSIEQLIVNLTSSGKFSEVGILEVLSNPQNPEIFNFTLGAKLIEKEAS